MKRIPGFCLVLAVLLLILGRAPVVAEEGMWTFDNLPVERLQKQYGFKATAEWLEHVRLASVRFNDGGSGSFVSPTGLVLTNHHVAVGQLQKMSTAEHDYVKEGFLAGTRQREIQCVDLELNVLVGMRNVTREVEKVAGGLDDDAALKARKKEIARIESEATEKTGMRSDVVSLYHGGEYWLYTYKKYRDVRLVMAPEKQIAFYGGDSDNFTYPRYDLDFAFFRVYENDRPVESKHYFRFNPQGGVDQELVFVPGHPGSTEREYTLSQLLFLRDVVNPDRVEILKRRIALLEEYAKRGKEEKRRAATLIFGAQNGLKVYIGRAQGLSEPQIIEAFRQGEAGLQALVRKDSALSREAGGAWNTIDAVMQKYRLRYPLQAYRGVGGYRLPELALSIALYVNEVNKPDGERIAGFHEAQLDRWRFRVFSAAPVHLDLEEVMLADSMQRTLEKLGPEDPFVVALLGGKSPAERARELIQGTKMQDPEFRKALVKGGAKGVQDSTDSLVRLARQLEPFVRENIKWSEDNVTAVVTPATEKIARARFRIYGKTTYPDATFTLRLSYGAVKGYPMNGTMAPSRTTFYGLYDRYHGFNGQGGWDLPGRYLQRRATLDLATPMNFVSTNDIIGGNSGSPVIDRKAGLVGLVFDGNIQSLLGDFIYRIEDNRCVSVHAAAILEALRKLYDAGGLADELTR